MLSYSWVINVTELARVNELRRRIDELLLELERQNILQFDLRFRQQLEPWEQPLSDAGLRSGRATTTERTVILVTTSGGGSTGADAINEVVEQLAALPDNSEKLSTADGDEHHLFVWIDHSAPMLSAALGSPWPPESAPTVPDHVDVVWVADGPWSDVDRATRHLWRVRPPEAWEVLI